MKMWPKPRGLYNADNGFVAYTAVTGDFLAAIERGVEIADQHAAALTRVQVVELQTLLNELGYDTGGIDGLVGPRTEAAIIEAQESFDLLGTGTPNLRLLVLIREAFAPAPPTPEPVPQQLPAPAQPPADPDPPPPGFNFNVGMLQ